MAIKKELLPIIPIRGFIIFPKTVFHFDVARPKSKAAVEKALISDGLIFLAAQKDETAHRNGKEFLEVVGRGEYASDTALDFYKPLIQTLTAKADNRLF